MSAERFFDDLARTLAEPMPRRRAVRVIGVSLAALAIPGISPRLGRGAATFDCKFTPCKGSHCCPTSEDPQKPRKCCPYPEQQWGCGDATNGYQCRDGCPPTSSFLKQLKKTQEPTWSSAELPNKAPKKYSCCLRPDTIPVDGECLPNCKHVLGPNAVQCGKYCCPPGHRCKGGGQCIPCPRGQKACDNACCKSDQVCSNCREQGSVVDDRYGPESNTGRSKCCAKDERCCRDRCCSKNTHCCGSLCCGRGTICAVQNNRDICCSIKRFSTVSGVQICCPRGTEGVGGGCCPPNDLNCCPPRDNLGNVLSCASLGRICVNGACVKP